MRVNYKVHKLYQRYFFSVWRAPFHLLVGSGEIKMNQTLMLDLYLQNRERGGGGVEEDVERERCISSLYIWCAALRFLHLKGDLFQTSSNGCHETKLDFSF